MRDLPTRVPKTDWSDWSLLLVIVQTGSFRKAAERLNMNQTTVSRRIDALEERLGTTFFRRLPTGVELTKAGELAADYAITMARAALSLEDQLDQLDREVTGEVTIACGEALAVPFLAPRLKELQRANPKLMVNLLTQMPILEPSSGLTDIAIQFSVAKNMDSVPVELGTMHYCFVGSREYFDLYGEVHTPEDMLKHRVMIHTSFANFDNSWSNDLAHLREITKFCIKTDSGTAMVQAAASGAALSIMPSYICAYDSRLIVADLPPLAGLRFWLVFRESQRNVARIKTSVDWMKRIFDRKQNPWFRDEFVHPRDFTAADTSAIMPAAV